MIDPQQEARDKLALLHRAQDYRELKTTKGWLRVQAMQEQWLLDYMTAMKNAANEEAALHALRQWQIAEKLVDLQSQEIDETIRLADEIRGTLGLEEALTLWSFQYEQQPSGDPGAADSTSH